MNQGWEDTEGWNAWEKEVRCIKQRSALASTPLFTLGGRQGRRCKSPSPLSLQGEQGQPPHLPGPVQHKNVRAPCSKSTKRKCKNIKLLPSFSSSSLSLLVLKISFMCY